MELPNFVTKMVNPSEEVKEYFWALEIWEEGVKSAIWGVDEERPKVVALGSHEAWEGAEDLIAAAEKTFATAQERFQGLGSTPTKIIFGLPEGWISGSEIDKEKRSLLDNLLKRLDLTPIGFVSTFDAVSSHLKDVEGVPPTAILINPTRKMVYVGVSNLGKIDKVEEVSRSENLGSDVCEGLLRQEHENLPSRMILFDGEDMEAIRQILIAYPWQVERTDGKKLSFLHFPKVEILPSEFDIAAIVLSGGGEALKAMDQATEPSSEEKPIEDVIPVEAGLLPEAGGDNFGFVKDQDVSKMEEQNAETEEIAKEEPAKIEYKESDFAISENLQNPNYETNFPKANYEEGSQEVLASTKAFPKKRFGFLPKIRMPKISLRFSKLPVFLIIFLAALLILVGGVLGFFWFYTRAQVVAYFNPQIKETEMTLTVDSTQETIDETNIILPGQIKEKQITGQKQTTTTGQKLVGDKASGEITVFNRTDNPKVFPAGTVISGLGSLKFTLDEEVSVASKTPDLSSGVDKWGESKVKVTAADIGAQYNLAANSSFTFKDFPQSSYLGKNDSPFAGGTSRQIQAVSEKDQKDLQDKLTEELKTQVKNELLAETSETEKIIPESISTKVISAEFDHKVGEETQNESLNLVVKASVLAFSQSSFAALVEKSLSGQIPSDYEVSQDEIESQFTLKEMKKDGSAVFTVKIKANLLPKIDQVKLIQSLSGKTPGGVKEILKKLPSYSESEIILTPKFSFLLPRKSERIILEVRSR